MSECFEFSSSMTGSTNSGLLQPHQDSSPLPARTSPYDRRSTPESPSVRRGHRQRISRKMTLTPSTGQPIQLTPLWEHVVRTRRFPNEIDTRLTFLEISERLKDPEWEVRQHALRVLVDVLPTLNGDVVDKVMQPVVPELINNLGHPAPAVRKGALDALRVYLVHSRDREDTVKKILQDGLNRAEARDPHQTNVTTGVILSAPSLLFPSSNSPLPAAQLIKDTTIALASRLAQVPHQEAVLKSLMKIRDAIGSEAFENNLADYDNKLTRNIEILSKIYNVKPSKRNQRRVENGGKKVEDRKNNEGKWESDSDTSGIAEEEDEGTNNNNNINNNINNSNNVMPTARVVLETEIKFNEETAITMTILEEKEDSEKEQEEEESGTDVRNEEGEEAKDSGLQDRRKTPRRVHFGGEIVKLRTPDSDDTESVETPKTRIPVPVSPATRMPRRAFSQPCSPSRERRKPRRTSRSVSNSPKREFYTHNAELSPKKSILTRTSSPVLISKSPEQTTKKKKPRQEEQNENFKQEQSNESSAKEENPLKYFVESRRTEESTIKEQIRLSQSEQNFSEVSKNSSNNVEIEESKNDGKDDRGILSVVESTVRRSNSKQELMSSNDTSKDVPFKSETLKIDEKLNKEGSYKNEAEKKVEKRPSSSSKSTVNIEEKTSNLKPPIDFPVPPSIETRMNSPFGSPVDEEADSSFFSKTIQSEQQIVETIEVTNIKDEVTDCLPSLKTETSMKFEDVTLENAVGLKDRAIVDSKHDNVVRDSRNGDGERTRSDRDKKGASATEKNGNVGVAEVEGKPGEPSWEELGLVDKEVLEDLHNKEDWRARVRGLERVASALRTSSALIAIEPRLGSLLHAVLGCERSCRVAAAGLAVAKVVVAGVSEEALKKRLPQLAWGLARQGGPSAAQLARVTMLRLRPALLLEQFLQPQCLNARNAKTRENALQLLIFSLVTFPSTEFKVESVANKVAKMVGDRRRRVRQAALDTLAVLAQIYEPEEVLAAGKRAAEGHHDGEAMTSAIRARLARKSLPLVSADGLVVYGLQISPTVQIATGPDVDWIVAGSGSVSPGTGRTKGQVIAMRSEKGKLSRNGNEKNRESPWLERPNLVAYGVAMRPKVEQPVAWQIVPTQCQDDVLREEQLGVQETRNANIEIRSGKESNLRSNEQLRFSESSKEAANYRSIVECNFDHRSNFRNTERSFKEKEITNKVESRIPVLSSRDRVSKSCGQIREKAINFDMAGVNSRRKTKESSEGSVSQMSSSREENHSTYGIAYQRRKKYSQENNSNRISTAPNLKQPVDSTYSNYYGAPAVTTLSDVSNDFAGVIDNTRQAYPDANSRNYQKFTERERFVKKPDTRSTQSRASSTESYQRSVSRSIQQQSFFMQDMYTPVRRDGRFEDTGSFRQLQTAPTPLTSIYNEEYQQIDENDRSTSSRARFYRRTKDAGAQKIDEVELISSDAQTNGHFPATQREVSPFPCRRRLRSLSPSQLSRSRHFVRVASNELHAMSMYDIDKAVNEEEYNERNRQHFLPEHTGYHVPTLNSAEARFPVDNRESIVSKSASSSSSDISRNNRQQKIEEDAQDFSDSRSSSPQSQDVDAAFDIITNQSVPPDRDTVDSYLIPLGEKVDSTATATITSVEDDTSKDWSSEEEIALRNRSQQPSRSSRHPEFHDEDQIEAGYNTSDETQQEEEEEERRRSVVSVLSNERLLVNEAMQTTAISQSTCSKKFNDIVGSPTKSIGSPKKSEPYTSRSSSRNSNDLEVSRSPKRRNSRGSPRRSSLSHESSEFQKPVDERVVSSTLLDDSDSLQSLDPNQSRRESKPNSPTIIIASRPHSTEAPGYVENDVDVNDHSDVVDNVRRFIDEASINEVLEYRHSKDSASETNTEPAILKIESHTAEPIKLSKAMPSRVPRGIGKHRLNGNRGTLEKPEKMKPVLQQCFTQLESKDWEVAMKGLKNLSQITKQHPEYLDVSAGGTIGRLLGRHIKNLRSQVARAACMAAGDIFSSQIRGIDQDIDDIATPLLHRTADTNRFLRADCNAALDRMIEHLPPHKTIGVIVQRGASHQNAVVRAATGRLLTSIVDRIGPEHTLILPKDVRDKLLSTGARLLIDGNLDARNQAKKMFRRLTHCDGFRRILTDAVPETTLRHIDKTLRSL